MMDFKITFLEKFAGRGVYQIADNELIFLEAPIKRGQFWEYKAHRLSKSKLRRWFQIMYYKTISK